MGVAGLWEVLRPAGKVRSLTELAVEDGFNANPSRQRGFRIGIDASIWFFHAAYGREGENPELRTLFFRCCRLLQSPLLPLFVFDGPNRPAIKRGKRVGANAHWLTQGMKNIIDGFGFEWRVAPGEAEAELAYLNRVGIIDAVLSDDVDNFLFGATMVIRNPSNTLSGNRAHPVKNAQGKDDGNHVVTYTAGAILSNPSVALTRSGAILIGLLSGGDYIPAGLPGCGQKFATGLARAGFGDSLLKAVKELKGARLDAFLDQWRQDIRNELRTNKSGLLPSKKPSLAASLPDDFPSLPVLMSYADPLTSENTQSGRYKAAHAMWRNDPDPMRIASLCELYFEWGVKDVILHRFRTVLWPGVVCSAVRRVVVDEDTRRRPTPNNAHYPDSEGQHHNTVAKSSAPGTSEPFSLSSLVSLTSTTSPPVSSPSSPTSSVSEPSVLLLEVLSQRTHASTDFTLEYRVLVDPATLVERAESGVRGLRPPLVGGLFGIDPEDEDDSTLDQDADESASDDAIERLETAAGAASKSGTKKRKARKKSPTAPLRLWLPACMIRAGAPVLAEAYEEKVKTREERKAKRGTKGRRGGRARTGVHSPLRRTNAKNAVDDVGDESVPGPSASKTVAASKTKTKAVRAGGGGRRRPRQASEAQDDAYEFIDLSVGESPCSSPGEVAKENTSGKGKAKAKMGQTDIARLTAKTSVKTKATTTNTMKEFFNTTKPSISRPPAAKGSTLNRVTLNRVYEEENSAEVGIPHLLPKSSRPLDLLRAKSKSTTTARDSNFKSTSKAIAVPRHEEDSSPSSPPCLPSGSRSSAPVLPCRPALPGRKKPLFVDVSDTDSDIEVNDLRRPSSSTTAAILVHDKAENKTSTTNDTSVRADVDENLSTFQSEKGAYKVVGGVIDLTEKRVELRPESTPLTLTLLPDCLPSAPLDASTTGPALATRSPSKLAHILFRPALESEAEEESEGDELPTFHRGSANSRTKSKARTTRPVLRPFPMHLAFDSPVSPPAPGFREKGRSWRGDKNGDGDVAEVVDVFTTPRGHSPPCTPTPSPSPVHASAEPVMMVKHRQSTRSPTSLTEFNSKIEPHKKTKQRYHVSSDSDSHPSGNQDGVLKSPRESVVHSSPRHISHVRGRSSSPTPLASSDSARHVNDILLCADDVTGYVSAIHQPQPRDFGPTRVGESARRKTRSSDASAIYISSESEDEDDASIDHNEGSGGLKVDSYQDLDECTDQDVGGWADMGMILSVPPSLAPPVGRPVPAVPTAEALLPDTARASKFKPATMLASKASVRVPSVEPHAAAKIISSSSKGPTNDENTAAPRPERRAPLLIARAKQGRGRDDNIIDLTSD